MSLGYRIFFVHNEEVQRIAQKRFNSLFLEKPQTLPKYANQTIVSILVIYELVNRKPHQIVRIDTEKIRFNEHGSVDTAFQNEGVQLASSRVDVLLGNQDASKKTGQSRTNERAQSSIIDANKRFDERRWKQRHPEISGPLLKKVLASVFGSSA